MYTWSAAIFVSLTSNQTDLEIKVFEILFLN